MKKSNQVILSAFATVAKVWAVVMLSSASIGILNAAPANSVPGRILVKPRGDINESDLQQLLAAHGAKQHSAIHQINVRILNVPEAARDHVLEALQHHPDIEFAEPDALVPSSFTPNDPSFPNQWHLSKMQCPSAWDVTRGSSTVTIAICDSGIDASHPDLAAAIVPGWNFYSNNSDTSDINGHGTGVAGAAAAIGNNGVGVAGIAMNCRIMPLRISDTNGYASYSTMAQAISYAADHGARVANLSFKASNSSAVSSAAQYLNSKGGVLTVSAGNDGAFDATSDNSYLLTVSATDSSDTLASWSCTGNNVDLAAPGVSVLVTTRGGGYGWGSGTSFAAPCVAGVAALVISANPSLSATQIMSLLKQNADDLGAVGWDPSYGYGRVNAYKSVLAATGGTPPPPSDTTSPTTSITAPTGGSTVLGTVSVTVAASDNVGVTKVEFYVNGALAATSTTVPAIFSWNTTTQPNGSCSLQTRAFDAAGNNGTSAVISVKVQNPVPDTTAPSVQIASPTASSTLSGQATVAVAATDNVGVTRTEWYLNGSLMGSSGSGSASFAWNTTAYPNGSYTLQARALDGAGNSSTSAPKTVSVQNTIADTLAPTATITAPAAGGTVSGAISVNVSATDNVGVTRVEWYLNGTIVGSSASSSASFSWNTATCPNGACTLQARAYDAAGNVGSFSVTVSVNNVSLPADTVAPTVQITSPTSGAIVVKSTKVYVTSADNVAVTRVDLLVDGKVYSTSSLATTVFSWNTSKIARGAHTLTAVAYDAAGNHTTSASVTLQK